MSDEDNACWSAIKEAADALQEKCVSRVGINTFKHNRYSTSYDNTIIMNDITTEGGHIEIMENSPYAGGRHSVSTLYVDEEKRGQGIGGKLVDEFIKTYNTNLSAQTSNIGSVKLFYKKGFRPKEHPTATLEETINLFYESRAGSISMMYD